MYVPHCKLTAALEPLTAPAETVTSEVTALSGCVSLYRAKDPRLMPHLSLNWQSLLSICFGSVQYQHLVLDKCYFWCTENKSQQPLQSQAKQRGLFHSMSKGIESVFKGGMSSFYILSRSGDATRSPGHKEIYLSLASTCWTALVVFTLAGAEKHQLNTKGRQMEINSEQQSIVPTLS